MTEHSPNVKKWIEELRTTSKPQGSGYLKVARRDPADEDRWNYHYCCLGIGCELVPGLEAERHVMDGVYIFGGEDTAAPVEFMQWLFGFESDNPEDWPTYELLTVEQEGFDDGAVWGFDLEVDVDPIPPVHDYGAAVPYQPTAIRMNDDSGFTFAQIADVFDYFGVRGDPVRMTILDQLVSK